MRAREDVVRRMVPWLACFAFLAATLRVFDAAYVDARTRNAVYADNLIYYDMILDRVRHGDSLLGRTLLPSPYFVDLLLQLPLALGTRDFEQFAYDLALLYCGLLFAGLFVLARRNLGLGVTAGAASAFVALGAYYRFMPWHVVAHAFIQNHTSELFCGFFAASCAYPAARLGGWRIVLHAAFVAFNVASSAFFITTYVLPVLVGMAALLGTRALGRRQLVTFAATTLAATMTGFAFDAVLSANLWPIRADAYDMPPREALANFLRVVREELLPYAAGVLLVAVLALGTAVVLRLRMRTATEAERLAPTEVLLVFGLTSLATCVSMPLARGAFLGGYELRYVQEPAMLATFFVAVLLVLGATRMAKRVPAWR